MRYSMNDSDHWLDQATVVPAVDVGGTLASPKLVVIHYTAGSTMTGAISTLTAPTDPKVSCHLIVGPMGELVQCASFRTITWHAGESSYMGRKGCNSYSIGIELVNPGYARAGVKWSHTPTVRMPHKQGGPFRNWYRYTDAQYDTLNGILDALWLRYGPIPVAGHDDVSPGRKIDPGPAFEWARVGKGG
jgi:N-acetylmuramoyl-L-alanine amidase